MKHTHLKRLSTLLLCFLLPIALLAQEPTRKEQKKMKKHLEKVAKSRSQGNAIISMDTLFNAGEPYALMEVTQKILYNKNYSLKTFTGEEITLFNIENVPSVKDPEEKTFFYAILFTGSGARGEVKAGANRLAALIVDNELIRNNSLNPEGEARILLQYPPKFTSQSMASLNAGKTTHNAPALNYQTVERNRNATFFISLGTIQQDFKVIGTYSKESEVAQGTIIYSYSFFLPNGTLIAKASGRGVQAKSWEVVTMKDNKIRRVNTNLSKEVEMLAGYLSDYYYL